MADYSKNWGMHNIKKIIQPLFPIQREQQNLFWVRNRSPHAVELVMTILIFKKKKFSTTFWKPEEASHYPFKGLEYNLIHGCLMCFEVLLSYMSQQLFPLTLSEDRLSHTQNPWQSYDTNPTIILLSGALFHREKNPERPQLPHRILLPRGPRGHNSSHSHNRLHWGIRQELLHMGMCLQEDDSVSQKFKEQEKCTMLKGLIS